MQIYFYLSYCCCIEVTPTPSLSSSYPSLLPLLCLPHVLLYLLLEVALFPHSLVSKRYSLVYVKCIIYRYFLFHGLLLSCKFSPLFIYAAGRALRLYTMKSHMVITSDFAPIRQEDILDYYNNTIFRHR